MEVFEGNVNDKYVNLKIKEEVHIIDQNTTNSIVTKLDLDSSLTVALYCGKKRYVVSHDFIIEGQKIIFNKPFNIGDRIILESRQPIGKTPVIGIILYDLNGEPYNVVINEKGIISIDKHRIQDSTDVKYGELVTGDRTYTLLVDGGSEPYELKAYRNIETYITGTDGVIYKVEATEDELFLLEPTNKEVYSDTMAILGLDKKFYTIAPDENGNIIATEYFDEKLVASNVDLGVKIITRNFKNRLICIDNGVVSLLPYIDNGGYHNINFIDKKDGNIIRLTINDDKMLEMYDGIDKEGYSGTRMLDYFYFFDNEWNYNRMFVENGNLLFENCELDVVPDSKGVNLLTKDGEMVKLRIPEVGEGIHIVKCISLNNMGTFESPIEGFVMKINNETKLITVNKETNGFEIVDTDLPFRTNHHYVLSTDGRIYKLEVVGNVVTFVEGLGDDIKFAYYIEDGHGSYYYLNIYEGDLMLNKTNIIPENAKTGVAVVHHNGKKFRLQEVDNVPMFIETNETFDNEVIYTACINDISKYFYFNIEDDMITYNELGVAVAELNEEYEIECVTTGAFIKSNEMITRFDITDGDCVFNPISTFVHRIKTTNNGIFTLDVEGEPYEESLYVRDFDKNEYDTEVGCGYLYLMDEYGKHYVVNTNSSGKFIIKETDVIDDVDYYISSLIRSSKGLYRMMIVNGEIKLEKIFDNMFENILSYGNMIKMAFNIQSVNGKWYSLSANGIGEVITDELDTSINATGLLLKSNDGYNYGLGILNNRFVTYRTYIIDPNIKTNLFIKDKETNVSHKLFMDGDRLCSDICNDDIYNTTLIMYDVYNNEYKIEMTNSMLTITSL